MAVHKTTREEELIEATKLVLSMDSDDAVLMIAKLISDNERLEQENKALRSELMRVKEDKAENEAMYELAIRHYEEIIESLTQQKYKKEKSACTKKVDY